MKFLLSLTTLLMMTALSTNVFAEANSVKASNSNRIVHEKKLNNKVANKKTIEIKQKIEQLAALESQNRAIRQSIMPKIMNSVKKIKDIEAKSENSIKMKEINMQFLLVRMEIVKLIPIEQTVKYDLDQNSIINYDGHKTTILKSTNEEIVISLNKKIEIALQNSKTLQNIVKEYDSLLNLLG